MILLKLGGALLTDKTQLKALRRDALAQAAGDASASPEPLVVVHGAGSYGHIRAKEHGLKDGLTRENRAGWSRVHLDVRELHLQVMEALLARGLDAVSVPPASLVRVVDGRIQDVNAAPLIEALGRGFTPVTFGDAVFDGERGGTILSGDTLMLELARVLRPTRAVFATNVDGIFDRDPAAPGASLVPRLTPDALLRVGAGAAAAPDVTGGMAGKARHVAEIARRGIPVTLVNGAVPGRLADALAGKATTATEVRA